jgi:hypothetical protein
VSALEVDRNVSSLNRRIPQGLWSDLKREGLLPVDAVVPL